MRGRCAGFRENLHALQTASHESSLFPTKCIVLFKPTFQSPQQLPPSGGYSLKKKPDISHLFNPHPPYVFRHKWCAFQNKTVWVWVLQLRILPFKFAIWKAWSYATWRWEQAGKDFSDLCGEHPTTVLILKAVLKWCATWKDICYIIEYNLIYKWLYILYVMLQSIYIYWLIKLV